MGVLHTLICMIFFASGASALIFETLWFRQAGLALGNSIWASSLVLSGFMSGLALGNLLPVPQDFPLTAAGNGEPPTQNRGRVQSVQGLAQPGPSESGKLQPVDRGPLKSSGHTYSIFRIG